MHDDSYLKTLSEMFASTTQQVKEAVARGETLERVRKSVNVSDFKQRLAGESAVKKSLFDNYVAGPSIGAAYVEAGGTTGSYVDTSSPRVVAFDLPSRLT